MACVFAFIAGALWS